MTIFLHSYIPIGTPYLLQELCPNKVLQSRNHVLVSHAEEVWICGQLNIRPVQRLDVDDVHEELGGLLGEVLHTGVQLLHTAKELCLHQ